MSFFTQLIKFNPKKIIQNDDKNNILTLLDSNTFEQKKHYSKNNKNKLFIFRLNPINYIKSISITKLIKVCSYIYVSYYTCINIAMFFRRRNPNIFIIPKKLGGTLGKFYPGGFEPKMNIFEASLILSITNKNNLEEIKKAHKKLIRLNHPDFGGSPFLACKINEAKDLLIKNYNKNYLKYKI